MLKTKYLYRISLVLLASILYVSCTEKQELIVPDDNPPIITFKANGVSFSMVKVEGGTFRMGNDGYLFDFVENEAPSHDVSLSTFYIGKTEVTQGLWNSVMDNNPSEFAGDGTTNLPVENVSWDDCQTFIEKLNILTGRDFSLPTEAEWEYAARGGVKNGDYIFSGSDNLHFCGWYADNTTAPCLVTTKAPNELGICDMSGNVAEWCHDWYGMYDSISRENPIGQLSGTKRVVRGGGWNSPESDCRNTARSSQYPYYKSSAIGFRLALDN